MTGEAYGYAGGNPLARIDPSGLVFKKIGSFVKDTTNNVVDFGKETVQAARDGDYMKVAANVGTALAVVGTVAAVGALVVGTGGTGVAALGAIATWSTIGGVGIGSITTGTACVAEGISKNCQWGMINTVAGAIPLVGKIKKLSFLENEAMAHKAIKKVTQDNKWHNIRRYNKTIKKDLTKMSSESVKLMKRRNGLMVNGYLGSNSIGLASLIVSERDSKLSDSRAKKDSACK